MELVKGRSPFEALDLIYRLVATGVATQEAVPAAIAICAIAPEDPWLVCRLAASLGGDCDTVAAIAGTCHGVEVFPRWVVDALNTANPDLALEDLADQLFALRTLVASASPAHGATELGA
jgi:ADP-ribosylglycohydrolase